ncbi:hypothetical protein [Magnetovibrio blakemorei]|uniref:Uncharacterized protein n=1 Tax=Magnetovibrio blakemorei TaxID=28181 RepID=A0A1E5Q353_9PROT|nr:hypothetical protein [Magnetovibrio blakemorei]OEJ63676.1 hypothetical protein BEN30_17570 [Magnetovibrio blakemorei]
MALQNKNITRQHYTPDDACLTSEEIEFLLKPDEADLVSIQNQLSPAQDPSPVFKELSFAANELIFALNRALREGKDNFGMMVLLNQVDRFRQSLVEKQ